MPTRASIANGIACMHFIETSRFLRLDTIADDRIGSASRWLSNNFGRYTMVHCNHDPEIHEYLLMRETSRICIAFLEGVDEMGETVNQAVVIDFERCTIFNS